jgi:UDP-N-acetylglucosamine--N-acetylmuramyl-(pentapeptide) pyrophosphoryl-undecaprenol N-acetylglucosamine transferase
VIPAIPVMQALLEEGVEVAFVGSRSGLEENLLRDLPVRYFGVAAGKLRRYFSLRNLLDAFRVIAGIFGAIRVVAAFQPDVVFSKGGFVSFPVVLAAWIRGVPVVAHESDLTPGLANRLALPFVRTLCVNFPVTRPKKFKGNVIHAGTPVRESLLSGDPQRGRKLLGVEPGIPVLLVTGGSLGADAINNVVRAALPDLCKRGFVVHVCGPGKRVENREPRYVQYEYVREDWGDLLAAADIVVSRAGANTLYELFCLGKPNLLVPLSMKASRGDQLENAAYARSLGYSRVLSEEEFTPATLLSTVDLILADPEAEIARLRSFAPPDSVRVLVRAIRQAAGL